MALTSLQKPVSRVIERRIAKAKTAASDRDVYRAVTLRDGRKCRACCGQADPDATNMLKHGHRHHIIFRSMGGATTTQNVCLVCNACHADIHGYRLTLRGNADKTLIAKWVCLGVSVTRDGR